MQDKSTLNVVYYYQYKQFKLYKNLIDVKLDIHKFKLMNVNITNLKLKINNGK